MMRAYGSLFCIVTAFILMIINPEAPPGSFIEEYRLIFIMTMLLPVIGLLTGLKAQRWKTFVVLANILGILTITVVHVMAVLSFA